MRWGKLVWPAVGIALGTAVGGLFFGIPILLAVGLATVGVAGVALVGHLVDKHPAPAAYALGGILGVAFGAASVTAVGSALAGAPPTTAIGAATESVIFYGAGAASSSTRAAAQAALGHALDEFLDLEADAVDWKPRRTEPG